MGYRVEYGAVKKVRGLERRIIRLPAMTAAAILVFLLMVTSFWPEGNELLRRLVIPGDPAVTTAAFEEMTQELRSGEAVPAALRTFCRRVLDGAELGAG